MLILILGVILILIFVVAMMVRANRRKRGNTCRADNCHNEVPLGRWFCRRHCGEGYSKKD